MTFDTFDTVSITADVDTASTGAATLPTDGIHILDIIADMIALRNTLQSETRHLKTMNMKAVREMHDYKLKLIRRVEIQKELISRDPAILTGRSEVTTDEMRLIEVQLQEALKENFHEVLKAKEVNRRVVEAISRAVNTHSRRASGYNQQGAAPEVMARASAIESVALNQMI